MKKIIKLNIDEDEDYEDIKIFCIYTDMPDYKLAFFLNQKLSISLKKKFKFFFQREVPFFKYNCYDSYHLFKNKIYSREKNLDYGNMFFDMDLDNYSYIYNGKKNVDFFFRYKGNRERDILDSIREIYGVRSVESLGRKDYLTLERIIESQTSNLC